VQSPLYDPFSYLEFGLYSSFATILQGPPFTPLEVGLIILLTTWIIRRNQAKQTYVMKAIPMRPLWGKFKILILLLLCSVLWGYIWGVAIKHGDYTKGLWEIRAFVYMFIIYVSAGAILTTKEDWASFLRLQITAIGLLGLKVVIRAGVWKGFKGIDEGSFDHENALLYDSFLLFGLACWVFRDKLKDKAETWGKRWWILYICLVPFVIMAIALQQRRGGLINLALGMGIVFGFGLIRRTKVVITLVLTVGIVFGSYYVAFSKSESPIGLPAHSIAVMLEPSDRNLSSNKYREIEFGNLWKTIQTSPIFGIGFGQEFIFFDPMPDLSWWPFWHYTPHNEIMWVWLKIGTVGYVFFWLLWAQAIIRGVIIFWHTRGKWEPVILVAICAIVMQLVYAWLDQGFSIARNLIWLGSIVSLLGFWELKPKLEKAKFKLKPKPEL
jgi:O-antigen ligase